MSAYEDRHIGRYQPFEAVAVFQSVYIKHYFSIVERYPHGGSRQRGVSSIYA